MRLQLTLECARSNVYWFVVLTFRITLDPRGTNEYMGSFVLYAVRFQITSTALRKRNAKRCPSIYTNLAGTRSLEFQAYDDALWLCIHQSQEYVSQTLP